MRRRFMLSVDAGNGLNPDGGIDYYVSENGTGNGLSQSSPMNLTSFNSVILQNNDRVFFLAGDEF